MCTLPRWAGVVWRGDWSCCCRGIPQSAPKGHFLFGKILLLISMALSVQGRAGPLTQPTSPARRGTGRVRAPQAPTFDSPQPAPTVSVGLPLRPYSHPCDFKQPGLSQCSSSLVWQGREPLTWLFPRSPVAGLVGTGLGLQLPWSPGTFCLEAISLLSVFSVSSILFGLLSS